MAQLLDQYGKPIQRSVLTRDLAAPTVMGVRHVVSGHPAQGLTPGRLASILRESETGSPVQYLELAEEMEEKHLHYRGVLSTRKLAVCQLEVTVDAASEDAAAVKQADFIRDWLDRDELEGELFHLLDAIGKGFSRVEIIWDTSEGQWVPSRLEWRDPRWFDFDQVDRRTPLMIDDDGQRTPLPPFKFLCHDPITKSGLPVRGGLARAAAWAYLFQNYAVKDWVAFAEIYGLPFRIGKYDNAETEENKAVLARALAQMGVDAAAMFPKSMEVEFIDGKSGDASGEVFKSLAEYLDKQISKAVLGQTATTDAETGGLGSGKEHGDVREDIERADAKALAATVNRDLVKPIIDLNFGPQKKYPRLRIGRADQVDIDKFTTAVERMVRVGLRVGQAEVRDKLGIEDPGEDEELLSASAERPPEMAQDAPGGKGGAPTPAGKAAPGFLRPLKASYGAIAASATPPESGGDLIDQSAERDLDGWRPVMAPKLTALETLAAACSTFEEFQERLPEALAGMDSGQLTELLAQGAFAGKIAGLVGVDLAGADLAGEG